jgi:hypothetical protein
LRYWGRSSPILSASLRWPQSAAWSLFKSAGAEEAQSDRASSLETRPAPSPRRSVERYDARERIRMSDRLIGEQNFDDTVLRQTLREAYAEECLIGVWSATKSD